MKSDVKLKKAEAELEEITGDRELRRLAELRHRYTLEMNSAIYYGQTEGREKGIKEGRREGRKEGRIQKNIEITKALIKKGMDNLFISEVTKLSEKQIQEIRIKR